jgi:hypothetical protein
MRPSISSLGRGCKCPVSLQRKRITGKSGNPEREQSSSGSICSKISSSMSPSAGGGNAISGNTALSIVQISEKAVLQVPTL